MMVAKSTLWVIEVAWVKLLSGHVAMTTLKVRSFCIMLWGFTHKCPWNKGGNLNHALFHNASREMKNIWSICGCDRTVEGRRALGREQGQPATIKQQGNKKKNNKGRQQAEGTRSRQNKGKKINGKERGKEPKNTGYVISIYFLSMRLFNKKCYKYCIY